jgi:hypothetical protein
MSIYRINKPRNAQSNFHVKKNDEVVILSGTQQGQRGKVLEVLRNRSRVIIEGVNFIKRHSRKSPEFARGRNHRARGRAAHLQGDARLRLRQAQGREGRR